MVRSRLQMRAVEEFIGAFMAFSASVLMLVRFVVLLMRS